MALPIWDDETWSALPRLDRDITVDVCVVGLGASGLTAVHALRGLGVSVVGVDSGSVGGGAAGRNGGFLLAGPAHAYHHQRDPLLYRRTLTELGRLEEAGFLRRTGSLRIETTDEGLRDCWVQRAALLADGFEAVEYDGPEGRGLLFPQDGVTQPLDRCRALGRLALAAGAQLFEHSPVTAVAPGGVTTEGGSVACGAVLVLMDGRLDRLLPEVPVRTVRLQMLGTAPLPPLYDRPVYLRGGYEYWQQLPDGRLAVGGFRDIGGEAEETTSTEPSAVVQAALDGLLMSIAPRAVVTHRWAASVGFTDDALPFLGEVRQGVWAAGGYSGTGNVIGALCARQLVSNVVGGPTYWS